MKKSIGLLFLMVLPFVLSLSIASASDKTYVISYCSDSPSHQLVKDRIQAAYQRAGFKSEFIPLPHSRSILSANEGTVDGDVGRVPLVEETYLELRRVNVKVRDLQGAAFVIDPKIDIYDESLLDKYRVGYMRGVRWAEGVMAGRTAVTTNNTQALFEMLLQGRIDLVLTNEISADSVLSDLGSRSAKIRQLQPFVYSAPIYHYVNKKNAAIIPRLEQAIKEINEQDDAKEE